jgi:ATP-dependent helicase/nuclease subunit B
MDGVELLPIEITEALERGAIVVTGNQRAARALRQGWDRRNRELGLRSWEPAMVVAWDAWMASLWRALLIAGNTSQLLLNRFQEQAVWRSVLEADEELASLRTLGSLAEMAAETWRLVCRYEGQWRLRWAAGNADARAFQRWALLFERRCRTGRFLPSAQLEESLREAVEKRQVELPLDGVVLVGFDGMTPAQTALVDALRTAGVEVQELRPTVNVARRILVEAKDDAVELSVAARWIRGFLEDRPKAKVAVIVPGPETQRSEIDRIFREVLAPELQDIRVASVGGPYEFSLGVALAETSMVATALDLLRWAIEPLPLERVSELLLSPHLAMTNEEQGAHAEFDAFELRKTRTLRPEISLDGFIAAVEASKRRSRLGRLLGALRAMWSIANRLQGMAARTNAEWAEKMRGLLLTAEWALGPKESSVEFQTRRKWESALDELATLDFEGVRVEFVQALKSLEQIAQQTTFAPESRDTPVQVMGPLEAAGGTFDALWFLRAGELSWPMEVGSNSLLPWPLQRELGMPGTDTVKDSKYARRMTERIAGSAGTVVFSYAKESAEGRQRRSPELAGLVLEEIDAAKIVAPEDDRVMVELEEYEDSAIVPPLPDRVISGGAAVLQLQAACGFRAFAERRLGSTELKSVALGMDALDSGVVVHRVMETFWGRVESQDNLRTMTVAKRDDELDIAINEGLTKFVELDVSTWEVAYVEMQRERLRRLLRPWLQEELARPPFTVKQREETARDVQIGPLHLSVRMDRVDETAGGELVIDYKTGRATTKEWLSERPDAPQLPLYAVVSDSDRLGGVAFARLKVGKEMGWHGFAASNDVLLKPVKLTTESFAAQVEEWRGVLTRLAEQFAAGDARVRPKHYPKTCDHCAQRLLCRVVGSTLARTDEEDETGDSPGVDGE